MESNARDWFAPPEDFSYTEQPPRPTDAALAFDAVLAAIDEERFDIDPEATILPRPRILDPIEPLEPLESAADPTLPPLEAKFYEVECPVEPDQMLPLREADSPPPAIEWGGTTTDQIAAWMDPEPAWTADQARTADQAQTDPAFETTDELPPTPEPLDQALHSGVTTAQRVVRARVASVASRSLSWCIDGTLLLATVGALLWAAGRIAGVDTVLVVATRDPLLLSGAFALTAMLAMVYTTVAAAVGGQTIGGRIVGIKILDGYGEPPGLARAFVRAAAAVPGTLLFMVGLVWVVLDERGQALHDRLAATFVVEV